MQVEGLFGTSWIIGWALYVWISGLGNYYAILVSFFTALFFGDWMTAESDAKDLVYDILTPYY